MPDTDKGEVLIISFHRKSLGRLKLLPSIINNTRRTTDEIYLHVIHKSVSVQKCVMAHTNNTKCKRYASDIYFSGHC